MSNKLVRKGSANFYNNENMETTFFPSIRLEYDDRKITDVKINISNITFFIKDQITKDNIYCNRNYEKTITIYGGKVIGDAIYKILVDDEEIDSVIVPTIAFMPEESHRTLNWVFELSQSFNLNNIKPSGYDYVDVIVGVDNIRGNDNNDILLDNMNISGNLSIFVNQLSL